jgi:hypothetical protein
LEGELVTPRHWTVSKWNKELVLLFWLFARSSHWLPKRSFFKTRS